MRIFSRLLPGLALALLAFQLPAQAGWLTITNPPPSNEINLLNGQSHALTLPGFGGTASVSVTSQSGNAFFLLQSSPFQAPTRFSEYPTNGLNPSGVDQYVVAGNGGSGNNLSVRFDFSGLTGGVLPSGSIFTLADLDSFESFTDFTGYNGALSQILAPWLSLVSSFDANGATGGTASSFSTNIFSGGAYHFASSADGDIPTNYFVTTEALSAVTFNGSANFGPRGYSVAFATSSVPEPGTFGLLGLACGGLAILRRKQQGKA
jgi:hypothetical protein